MEKKPIVLTPKKWIAFEFTVQGEVQVKPFLSLEDKLKLIDAYLSAIFEDSEDKLSYAINEIQAEYTVVLGIIDLCTNLSIDFAKDSEALDNIIGSRLWNEVISRISNYSDFRLELNNILSHIKEDIAVEKSLGVSFDKVSMAVSELVYKLSTLNISEEGLKAIIDEFQSKTEKLISDVQETPFKKPRKKRTAKKEITS
jgi:hypothetical protein